MKIECIIIDDEPIARDILEQFISRDSRLLFKGGYRSAIAALGKVPVDYKGIIFLDIKMPELSGIDFLKTLQGRPHIIFTTAFREYALDGFDLNAVDYLLKPFSFERFLQAINKAIGLSSLANPAASAHSAADQSFFIKDGAKLVQLQYDDVLYMEASREYVNIVTREKSLLVYHTMKDLEQRLPPDRFIRIHKSYIVSIARIRAIENNQIVIGNQKLPISRQLKATVVERITGNKLI